MLPYHRFPSAQISPIRLEIETLSTLTLKKEVQHWDSYWTESKVWLLLLQDPLEKLPQHLLIVLLMVLPGDKRWIEGKKTGSMRGLVGLHMPESGPCSQKSRDGSGRGICPNNMISWQALQLQYGLLMLGSSISYWNFNHSYLLSLCSLFMTILL